MTNDCELLFMLVFLDASFVTAADYRTPPSGKHGITSQDDSTSDPDDSGLKPIRAHRMSSSSPRGSTCVLTWTLCVYISTGQKEDK
uniref:uncharacterized protein LOC131139661 isoform X2 n=1 Tax=Doryrhamphus excisus TaxID=161450 RepID=UPI0025AE92C1|nr:uncharacterized protein LOC131139661 isoform X2 [Doryrhamphus excisus]